MLDQPERWLTNLQRRWLRPRGMLARAAFTCVYIVNWSAVRMLFRFSIEGRENLPVCGPFILTPNHASALDPPLLGAALPLAVLQQTYWAGKRSTVLRNWRRKVLSWAARVIPIANDSRALAPALTILQRGDNLVWFPEGRRSPDGQLQAFKPGVAHLITRCNAPIVPVFIYGAFAAFPTGAKMPRFRAVIVVRIGQSQTAEQLGLKNSASEDLANVLAKLRQHVAQLRDVTPAID